MASSQCERKVLRFDFIIYNAVDWEINKQTNEIINSITNVSLVKALEATTALQLFLFFTVTCII